MSPRTSSRFAAAVLAAAQIALTGCNDRHDRQFEDAVGTLVASEHRLEFGATTLGLPIERVVSLAQRGRLPAQILSTNLTPDEKAFTLSEPPERVAMDGATRLVVTYRPTVAGTHKALLELELLDGDTVSIALEGRGVDAKAVPTGAVDFGRPAVGAVRRRALSFRNDFETPVPVTLNTVGTDASEFTSTAALWLAPYSELTANLRYEPVGRAGKRDAQLEVVACPLCAAEELPIAADAVPDALVISPNPADLGGVQIDSEKQVEIRITNATDEVIDLREGVLGTKADPGFTMDPFAAGPLLPLMTTSAKIRFSPTRVGYAEASLELDTTADPQPARSIPLMANGGGSQLVVAPGRLDFGKVPAGGRAVATLVITNGGADPTSPPLHVQAIDIDNAVFTVVAGLPPGTALAARESKTIKVAFDPKDVGAQRATLTVHSDDPTTPTGIAVLLVGEGTAPVQCQLKVDPPMLDFGGVRASKAAVLAVRITNAGEEGCSVWDGAVSGSPAFRLDRQRPMIQLPPGGAFTTPVVYAPTAEGRFRGTLSFQTNRVDEPTLEIELVGGSDLACLRPEPGYVEFGARRMDCGPAELTATWKNYCSRAIDVSEIFLGTGTDETTFSLTSTSTVPRSLAPMATVEAKVRLNPLTPGFQTRPIFAQGSDAELPLLIPISAEVQLPAQHDESYVQPAPAKVDMLWVIDNTASMKDERANLARNIAGFLKLADDRGIDYHIGVTTTGVGKPPSPNGEVCNGGVGGDESGRLFPVDHARPRIIDRNTPNRADVLAQNLDVGSCHSVEQGFEAASRALTAPLVDNDDHPRTAEPLDGNLGLLRDDASLAIIVVSDEDDESPYSVDFRIKELRSLKPTSPKTFNAIVAPAGGCASATEPGTRYLEAVRAIGGVSASICEADWSVPLTKLADDLFAPRRRIVLGAEADSASLVVTVNEQPATGWRYDATAHAIEFTTTPAAGSRIRVQYKEPCP